MAVHRCLSVHELRACIVSESNFQTYYNDHNTSYRPEEKTQLIEEIADTLYTLLSLATTCHALSGHALDVLWQNQYTLAPLVQVLPPHLWKTIEGKSGGRVVTLSQTPETGDWGRFDFYARKIRTLGLTRHQNGLDIDFEARELVAGYNTDSRLLPNLKEVALSNKYEEHTIASQAPALSERFLHTHITHLVLSFTDADDSSTAIALCNAVRRSCPKIQILEVFMEFMLVFHGIPSDLTDALNDLVCSLGQLRSLATHYLQIQWRTMEHVQSLLNFEHLELEVLDPGHIPEPTFKQPCFPSLCKFGVVGNSWDSATKAVSAIRGPLQSLKVFVMPIDVGQPQDPHPSIPLVDAFVHALTLYPFYESLTCLDLANTPWRSPNSIRRTQVGPNLRKLFLFPSILELYLGEPFSGIVNDSWLADATTTWPHLQQLDIGPFTQTTLQGLVPLVRGCKDLRRVSIGAEWASFDMGDLGPMVGNPKIRYIYMSMGSQIKGDIQAVFRCLVWMFPRLRKVVHQRPVEPDFTIDRLDPLGPLPDTQPPWFSAWDELQTLLDQGQ